MNMCWLKVKSLILSIFERQSRSHLWVVSQSKFEWCNFQRRLSLTQSRHSWFLQILSNSLEVVVDCFHVFLEWIKTHFDFCSIRECDQLLMKDPFYLVLLRFSIQITPWMEILEGLIHPNFFYFKILMKALHHLMNVCLFNPLNLQIYSVGAASKKTFVDFNTIRKDLKDLNNIDQNE